MTRSGKKGGGAGAVDLQRVQAEVVAAVQAERVLPHCPTCRRPCCNLDTLVLELDWRRLRLLWAISVPRREFDARLARGTGPEEVRSQEELYYVHGKVCPAFRDGRCLVYGSEVKPPGCSDFPLYVDDGGGLLADLRCEALDVKQIGAALRGRLPPNTKVYHRKNPEFPFLVTFRVARERTTGGRGRSRAGRRRR